MDIEANMSRQRLISFNPGYEVRMQAIEVIDVEKNVKARDSRS